MSRIVCKFGGSSVADAGQFKKIKAIVESDKNRKVIVVSAPGKRNPKETKLTDLLYSTYDLASKGLDFSTPWNLIRQRYDEICKDLGLEDKLTEDLDSLEDKLKNHPESVSTDFLVSRGEFLCARLMAKYLGANFVDSYPLITFDDKYRIAPKTYEEIAKALGDENQLYVLPGFYGSNLRGEVKTFSRGGSDITGAILANGIDAAKYENWTDVSGMLMADPRIVKNPKVIKVITYSELRELSYMGATVLHDEAIFPVREARIPINIRNTNAPEEEGTMIVPFADKPNEDIITGVAGKVGFSIINIEKSMMNSEVGFGKKILKVIENHDICFEHLPSGIDTMSVVVDTAEIDGIREDVVNEMFRKTKADFINVEDGLALIAVVGRSMVQQVGTAGRVFTAMGKAGVNIKMIDQGSSELSIIIGINEADYAKTLNAIYSEFVKE